MQVRIHQYSRRTLVRAPVMASAGLLRPWIRSQTNTVWDETRPGRRGASELSEPYNRVNALTRFENRKNTNHLQVKRKPLIQIYDYRCKGHSKISLYDGKWSLGSVARTAKVAVKVVV